MTWLRRVLGLPPKKVQEPVWQCPKCQFAVWAKDWFPKPKFRYCGPDLKAPRCDELGEHFDFYMTCARCGYEDQWRRPLPEPAVRATVAE